MTARLVVASVGTYHLPFDRFSEWLERWVEDRDDVRLVVQHGPSRRVQGAENVTTLAYEDLLNLCRSADVVVLQGGAGGVMDMRSIGVEPIVVPRIPGGGEVVDDHQLVFCETMERIGVVTCARSYDDLSLLLDLILEEGARNVQTQQLVTPGAAVVGGILDRPIARLRLSTIAWRALQVVGVLLWGRLRRTDR